MQKLVMLTILSLYLANTVSAQETATPEENLRSSHPTNKLDLSVRRPTPDTKKVVQNPAYHFKDLFETTSLGLTSRGPSLNPRAVSFVKDYVTKNGKDLMKMKVWGKPFFDMMDGIFLDANLPVELKYIAVIESRLRPMSTSIAGAVGPWQFMPATAIRMGLKVNRMVDQRTNYIKSTQAAAKYLTELYDQFGDWLLVIAAYNGGPGNVFKAIRRSNSHNFWDIQYYLPAESRNHVKKFISTHYLFEGQGGLTTLTRAESLDHYGIDGKSSSGRRLSEAEEANSKEFTVTGKYYSVVIARNISMDIEEFNRYNPGFDKEMASANNSYSLRLPVDKLELFSSHKYQILNESIQLLLTSATSTIDAAAKPGKSSSSKQMD
jgi:membrane-bound lytic murein transglycosylase D